MPFDRRRMRFHKGVVLTQAQWDEIQNAQPKSKISPGILLAMLAGLSMGVSMERPRRKPPTSLDDFD